MRALLSFFVLFVVAKVASQPSTEVYLLDIDLAEDTPAVTNPKNISTNVGYDNQPSFSASGEYLYYTSLQADNQTDIIQYNLQSGEKVRISESDGSEYSPTEMPDGKGVSTIILKRDGEQLLWRYDLASGKREVLVPELVIGYHCWYDATTIFSFVLGEQSTLQRSNLTTGENVILDQQIGRSLHRIPKTSAISYISKKAEAWDIIKYDPATGQSEKIAPTLEGSEDLCWTPDGAIIMGKGSRLYVLKPGKDWQLIVDFSKFGLAGITRLAMSPAGDKLAVVVNE